LFILFLIGCYFIINSYHFQNYKHFQPFLPDSSLYPRITQLLSQNFKDYLNQYYTLDNYLIFLKERSYYLQIYLYFSY